VVLPRAVVLLSGGLDSATAAAIAVADGREVYGLAVDYGQRHRFELEAALRLAPRLGLRELKQVRVDLAVFGGSALTSDLVVPKDRAPDSMDREIPVTYVPARNTVFLSLALAYAETLGAAEIFLGVNAVDYSGYPDCRPEYIAAFERLANLATKAGVEGRLEFVLRTPLIAWTKARIIQEGVRLGVDYGLTHSCYDPSASGAPCGRCDACLLRRAGFGEAGLTDPLTYPGDAQVE